ncbi:hypothetical protein BASA50_009133 [Batrachochytrium salamandrivorans]|uniref:Flavin reductase like domain-containing protein n=1 Tax=Batrachochytrium salamandrivorans TaxID=1357716 RepID=A0ABQ8F633_9FUNG|nr:hypothetical protein BASA62_006371 [Batrachochytrium salamandrivorans]KAH6572607.1 hypothetical protein BASA60_006530 [Batrachochytrium salamandrivorans]KAH6579225.1 hypothetical protein BASA61_010423 [Batrachochytrium salamandrivorans]KAH6591131.1 hypothetical protein BASA50_009133 [Batrachochytrium salamandrivorans]KAH9277406.1 hypothetical protein BASA83_000276 [Batrachochytrium salamandrivorans]
MRLAHMSQIPCVMVCPSIRLSCSSTTYRLWPQSSCFSASFIVPRNARSISTDVVEGSMRQLMRQVPQPVVVVTVCDTTTAPPKTRAMTCSSFTSVSLTPPIVSFGIRSPSSMTPLLLSSSYFAVHLLSKQQIAQSVAFSSPRTQTDFTAFPHHFDDGGTGLPILHGSLSVLICRAEQTIQIGDHEVWFGRVERIVPGLGVSKDNRRMEPLLYYNSSYRSIGDEVFIDAFEKATLSFDEWSHRAHLRMAWNYLREVDGSLEKAIPRVKEGIFRYNAANTDRVKTGYNETITVFFLKLTAMAIDADMRLSGDHNDFLEFLGRYPILENFKTIFRFYSKERLYSESAKSNFLEPDLKPIPDKLD